jgi:hypothetical protein
VGRFPWYGWVGLIGLLAGHIGVGLDVFPVTVLFYCIAWWSYILIVDALVWRCRGDSLLRSRPREFAFLAFWSVALWNLFEALNFRVQNWFYVNVPTGLLYGAVFSVFSFSTVLPGIFETYDLLCTCRVGERLQARPWRIGPAALRASLALGVAMLAAPLLWPEYAFPFVWGFAVFLGEPFCYRSRFTRARSLLGHLERGDPRLLVRLLLAGLICGGLWEFWNSWAHTRWIYTVPLFDHTKWFEMPPPGFLGFPPFALECYVLVNLLNLARGGRSWEAPPSHAGGEAPHRWVVPALVGACLFNLAVYAGIDRFTVRTYSPRIAELNGVSAEDLERLTQVGIIRPEALLRHSRTAAEVSTLSDDTGISPAEIHRLREVARLADLDGLGAANANALRALGITRVELLAAQDPTELCPNWRAEAREKPPTLPQVKAWIRAARGAVHSPDYSRRTRE